MHLTISIMKNIFKTLTVLLALSALISCAKWEQYNTDPYGVSTKDLEADYNNIGAYYPEIMQSVYFHYDKATSRFQMTNNLTADIWSGQMAIPSDFGQTTAYYAQPDKYIKRHWDMTYQHLMSVIENFIKPQADNEQYQYLYAPALIVKVFAMMRITDSYGPIIYTKYGKDDADFDSQEEVYKAFFTDLDTAVAALDAFLTQYPDSQPFEKFDCWYTGDFHQWIKLANSLRLRLAMHIVKKDAATAKAEALKAINNKYGLITENADNCTVGGPGWSHPLYIISTDWEDCRMSALMESFLLGYKDPRVGKFFQPTKEPAALEKGYEYKGIRLGIPQAHIMGDNKVYKLHSGLNFGAADRAVLFTAAETNFLLAEACLRGWISGSVQSYYETGVAKSFEQWGAGDASAYLQSTAVPADYEDVLNPSNSIASVNHLCPKWDESASNEVKLERIMDQKWIAVYPEGHEAWCIQRRTGYPHLFPIVDNYSQGVFQNDDNVKRMQYPEESVRSNVKYDQAKSLLGGPDNGATRLWWDVEGPNF